MGAIKTSIYLPADLAAGWQEQKDAGHTMTDVIRAGLAALGSLPTPLDEATLRRALRDELTGLTPASTDEPARCPECGGKLACPACYAASDEPA